jgi:hypothetical protein
MQYVGRDLVLRLHQVLSESLLATISQDFADILNGGEFEQHAGRLKEEKDDETTNDMSRLVFNFNRRAHGRLRLLINLINESAGE